VFELSYWEVRAVFRDVGARLRERHVPVPAGYAPHKCRHTYTIRHLQQGDDPTLIAENLGHSDTSTLFRDYAKIPSEGDGDQTRSTRRGGEQALGRGSDSVSVWGFLPVQSRKGRDDARVERWC
jgi:hypothetical protein